MDEQFRQILERLDELAVNQDSMRKTQEKIVRTLQGAPDEGATGVVVRQTKVEAKTKTVEDRQTTVEIEVRELRDEWRSFKKSVMLWALIALASGSAVGTVIGGIIQI